MEGPELRQPFIEKDLGAAAFLWARGHEFLGLRHCGEGFFGFEFSEDDGKCREDARLYFHGGQCSAQNLIVRLQALKETLRQQKKESQKNETRKPA